MSYNTLIEFKASVEGISIASILAAYSDVVIQNVLDQKQEEIDKYIGSSFKQEDVVDEKHIATFNKYGDLILRLDKKPVTALTKVTLRYYPDFEFSLPVADFEIYSSIGMVKYVDPYSYLSSTPLYPLSGAYEVNYSYLQILFGGREADAVVSYTGGYSDANMLKTIETVERMLAKEYFIRQSRSTSGDLKSFKSGDYQETYQNANTEDDDGMTSSEKRAYKMLAAYQRLPIY